MKELTQERLKELLDYDAVTGVFDWKIRSAKNIHVGDIAGCIKACGGGKKYRHIVIDGENYYAHRLAWLYVNGVFPVDQIDHIDGNGLNNEINNLREVDSQENQKNQRKHSNNTSGYSGVYWFKRDSKWYSQIKVCGKQIHLGTFIDFDDAVKARKEAEILHGFHEGHGSVRSL